MSAIPNEGDRERNELAAKLRERDRHREPRHVIARVNLVKRWAFQARVIDQLNELAAARPHNVKLLDCRCPICRCAIFLPPTSDLERLDCGGCGAALVSRRDGDGVAVTLEIGGVA